MPPPRKPNPVAFHAFMVLFTIFGIPIIIITPFLLTGFIGLR
jgi:hypothetical protein